MSSRQELVKIWNEFLKMMKHEAIHKFANLVKSEEVEGDDLYACKRSYNSFDSREIHDCLNIIYGDKIKDCADAFAIVGNAELCAEVFSVSGGYNISHGFGNWDGCQNLHYSNSCISCVDCFGCIGLKHKKNCILNKQYEEKEYNESVGKIIEQMKKNKYPTQNNVEEWGEFFPVQNSPFAYNETMAAVYYPLAKEEVLSRGWGWREENNMVTGKESLQGEDLPDASMDVSDEAMGQVVACAKCGRNYKFIKQELGFYKKQGLPLPKFCPECRFSERLALRNPRKLWPRQCSCLEDHEDHLAKVCNTNFKTTYQPGGGEKVFCENCYKKEIY